MVFDEAFLADLRKAIEPYMSQPRLLHTLAVERECAVIGKVCSLHEQELSALRVSALLHDLTKEMTKEEHLALLKENGLSPSADEMLSEEILHQRTSPLLIQKRFPACSCPAVTSPILSHTTGKPAMTTAEKILFLADVIEPRRKHEFCQQMRLHFYTRLQQGDPLAVVDGTLLLCLKSTIAHLSEQNRPIALASVEAYNHYTVHARPTK